MPLVSQRVAVLFTCCAVLGLLLAERRRSRAGVWLAKPLASLGFLLVAGLGAPQPGAYGSALRIGLGLCAAGDVLLIPAANGPWFLLGIGSFAAGHLAYAIGFHARGLALAPALLGLAAMGGVVALSLRWLQPHLPRALRGPVRVYMLVIACMVASAVGCSAVTGDARVAAGAIAFAISDLSVARERFVQPSFVNLVWGLPLYYAAQLVLALASGA